MIKFKLLSIFICLTFWCSILEAAPSLIADMITVTEDGNTIIAKGNVEITYKNIKVNAEEISYNKLIDQIKAVGPITFFDGQQSIIFADEAIFNKQFRDAVLTGTKFVLLNSLEITSEQITRKNGIINNFHNTRASTCKVCSKSDIPLWEIRAKRVYHDENLKQIFFYKSQFRFWGIPIAYLPLIRLPDPRVTRAKGFLTPDFNYSTSASTQFKLPYFIPLTDHSDVIISPAVNTNGSYSLGFDYRQLFKNSDLNIEAFGINDSNDQASKGYLFTNFNSQLNSKRDLRFQYQRASDLTVLSNYTNKNIKFTESYVESSEIGNLYHGYFGLYESTLLNTQANNSNMPNLNFKSNIDYLIKPKTIGSHAILSISADGYKRKSVSDGALGRDATSTNLTLSWQKDSLMKFGGIFGIKSFTTAGLSKYYNDSTNPNLINQIRQIAGVEFSLPLLSKYEKTSLIYNPKIQVVYSPPYNTSEPNEISQHSEVSSANFFNLNHSYGSDRVVNGMHLKTGLETSYYASKKDQVNLFIGNFTKLNGNNSFGIGSGLESETSSNIGAINVMLANKFSFDADFVTNSALQVTRNNMRISYTENYMDFYSHFFYKPKNEIFDERSELNFGSNFNLNKRTNATLSLAYDAKENKIMRSKLLSRYKHDCMKVDFYVSRDFNSGGSGSPGVKLGLQLGLMGLGAGKSSRALNEKNCAG